MPAAEVDLVGEGGVRWTLALPLPEAIADQVRLGKLTPADDDAEALLDEHGVARPGIEPGAPDGAGVPSEGDDGEALTKKQLLEKSRPELDELAAAAGVEDPGELPKKGDVADAILAASR